MNDNRTPDPAEYEYRDDLREHLSIHPMFEPPDNRTPDPAVQFVNIDQETDAAEHWEQYAVQVVAEAACVVENDGHDCHPTTAAKHPECAVAALREAGHIKNLRQVGWRYSTGGRFHGMERDQWDWAGPHSEELHAACTPVYVEEGEQR